MDFQALYRHCRGLLDQHWTATPWVPANGAEEAPVEPIKDRNAAGYPAAFVDFEITFEPGKYLTMTDSTFDGAVKFTFWVEPFSGEDRLLDLVDTMRSIFLANGDVAGGVEFMEPAIGDAVVVAEFPWYGREVLWPFVNYQAR